MRIGFERADGARLIVDGGRLAHADVKADLVLYVGAAHFHPGLINGHDHLYRNHYPRLGTPPYPDAYAWGLDIHERWRAAIERSQALPRRDALLFGACKNILGGATTVVHHDAWHDALDEPAFPVRVARVRVVHSLGFERDIAAAARTGDATAIDADTDAAPGDSARVPLCMHLAEGTNARAAAEVDELARHGLLDARLLAVHAVGVDRDGSKRLRAANAAIVWCPTSNEFLFRRTAPMALFDSGIDVLLGTDSLLTGAGTLLDELRAARALRCMDDMALLDCVGDTAARRLGIALPALAPGAAADVIALRAPLLEAHAADIALVLVRGQPVLADESLAEVFAATGVAAQPLVVGGVRKLVAAPLATIAERVFELAPECARIVA